MRSTSLTGKTAPCIRWRGSRGDETSFHTLRLSSVHSRGVRPLKPCVADFRRGRRDGVSAGSAATLGAYEPARTAATRKDAYIPLSFSTLQARESTRHGGRRG